MKREKHDENKRGYDYKNDHNLCLPWGDLTNTGQLSEREYDSDDSARGVIYAALLAAASIWRSRTEKDRIVGFEDPLFIVKIQRREMNHVE